MAFPALTVEPNVTPAEALVADPVIRTTFEAGYVQTRARFTRTRRAFRVRYREMPLADKTDLMTHVDSVSGGSDSFSWTHPRTSEAITVRYFDLPIYDPHPELYGDWVVEFTLEEV